jgi:hypothetical protein
MNSTAHASSEAWKNTSRPRKAHRGHMPRPARCCCCYGPFMYVRVIVRCCVLLLPLGGRGCVAVPGVFQLQA